MSFLFVIFYVFQMLSGVYEPFINSTGKLKLSLVILMFTVPLFIPFTYVLITDFELQSAGILIGLILLTGLPSSLLAFIQSRKLLTGAKGIWNQ